MRNAAQESRQYDAFKFVRRLPTSERSKFIAVVLLHRSASSRQFSLLYHGHRWRRTLSFRAPRSSATGGRIAYRSRTSSGFKPSPAAPSTLYVAHGCTAPRPRITAYVTYPAQRAAEVRLIAVIVGESPSDRRGVSRSPISSWRRRDSLDHGLRTSTCVREIPEAERAAPASQVGNGKTIEVQTAGCVTSSSCRTFSRRAPAARSRQTGGLKCPAAVDTGAGCSTVSERSPD